MVELRLGVMAQSDDGGRASKMCFGWVGEVRTGACCY